MRWLILLLVIVLPARADWFQFRPCGFGHDIESVPLYEGLAPEYIPSPNLVTILWWAPRTAVVRIVELEAEPGKMKCSWLAIGGDEYLVQGSAKEIYDYVVNRRMQRLAK